MIYLFDFVLLGLWVVLGGLLPLIERKTLSLTQRRFGPRLVGYKGRMQFIADSLKLLFKSSKYLPFSNKFGLFFLPLLYLTLNLLAMMLIYWPGGVYWFEVEKSLLVFVLVSVLGNLIVIIAGILSRNIYATLSSQRALDSFFIGDLVSSLFILLVVINFNSLSISLIKALNFKFLMVLSSLVLVPFFVLWSLIDMSKCMFDFIESETELIMGFHTEYPGFLFGCFILSEYLHLFIFTFIFYILFISY